MKYIVTIEGMRIERKCLTIDAATEREASDSAKALVLRLYEGFNPDTVKTTKIEEVPQTPDKRGRTAYLKAMI